MLASRTLARLALGAALAAVAASAPLASLTASATSAQSHPSASPAGPAAVPAQPAPNAAQPLFRVVLKSGTAVASYGEWARVGDRVIFSMPLAFGNASSRLQLMNLPASAVDWDSTTAYADSVRYASYVATRAEDDYAAFTGEIAELMREISLATDPTRKLELAERARRALAAWPREHLGYRSRDLREIADLVDAAVSELRARAGLREFDLALVATFEPPAMPLLRAPTPAELVAQVLEVARVADIPAERVSTLEAAVWLINEATGGRPDGWMAEARALAVEELNEELAIGRRYALLTSRALEDVSRHATNADVAGVRAVLDRVKRADVQFGQQRPTDVAALIGAIEERLDATFRLAVARREWRRKVGLYRQYANDVAPVLDLWAQLEPRLQPLRAAGEVSLQTLLRLDQQITGVLLRLEPVKAPTDLASVHALLVSATQLAEQAVVARRAAIGLSDDQRTRDAAAATAGALMLVSRARADLEAALRLPRLP